MGQLVGKDFDGDRTLEIRVVRAVHDPHPAFTDDGLDLIDADSCTARQMHRGRDPRHCSAVTAPGCRVTIARVIEPHRLCGGRRRGRPLARLVAIGASRRDSAGCPAPGRVAVSISVMPNASGTAGAARCQWCGRGLCERANQRHTTRDHTEALSGCRVGKGIGWTRQRLAAARAGPSPRSQAPRPHFRARSAHRIHPSGLRCALRR